MELLSTTVEGKQEKVQLACGATDLIIGKRAASFVKSWGSRVGSPAVKSEVTIPTATASPRRRLTVSRPWPRLVAAGMKAKAACSSGTCANPPRFQIPYRGWWAAAWSLGSAEAVPCKKGILAASSQGGGKQLLAVDKDEA